MSRFQRRLHLALWLLVGPACLVLLWLALGAQPVGEASFTITEHGGVTE